MRRYFLALLIILSPLLIAAPARADYTTCRSPHQITFNVDEYTTPDGYTGVVHSQGFYLNAMTPGCDKPYEGENDQCATFRINILDSPTAPWTDGTRGPWIRSCWTPVADASGWGGWIHQGDGVVVEARAMQYGIVKNWGGYVYN